MRSSHAQPPQYTNQPITQTPNHPTTLPQRTNQGTEYVVDCVSRDGLHKCVDMFVYDKRQCNGSKFVYFGT
jgi:hypothetical protein